MDVTGFCVSAPVSRLRNTGDCVRERRSLVSVALFGLGQDDGKKRELEETMRKQKEKLKRRNDEKAKKEYYESVQKRREDAEGNYRSTQIVKRDGEDPIEQWRKLQAEGKIKDIGEVQQSL